MLKPSRLFGGLRARLGGLLLLHTLTVAALLVLLLVGFGKPRQTFYRLPEADEVALIVHAIERAPADVRPAVVAAVSTDFRHVRLVRAPAPGEQPSVAPAVAGRLAAKLAMAWQREAAASPDDLAAAYRAVLGARPVHVRVADHEELRDFGGGRVLSDVPVRVLVPLPDEGGRDGVAVEIVRITPPVVTRLVRFFPALIGVIAVLQVVAIVVLAWQTTRPVSRLLAAVRSDGAGKPDPQWPTGGPREIQELGAAFADRSRRLKQLATQRTRIMAAVAHDFRTYLTRLELRADFIDEPRQRDAAMADLKEMSVLLDDTLTFARYAGETDRIPDEVIDLDTEITNAVEVRRGVGEVILVDPLPRPAQAQVARISFQRMLANLLDNAIRYGGHAGVRVTRTDGWLIVYVEDEGPGVPEDQLAGLTEPFHRLEQSRARQTGGSGLGLSIVEALLVRHGGRLTLANRPGGGFRAGLWLRAA